MSMLADEADIVDLGLGWTPGFSALGAAFFTELRPTPLPEPYWVGRSTAVAEALGLDQAWLHSAEGLAAFTGNVPVRGTRPYASVYSGHQFGVWAGQLGDGRAIMLGETKGGYEVQLKGSGRTPFSWDPLESTCRHASLSIL